LLCRKSIVLLDQDEPEPDAPSEAGAEEGTGADVSVREPGPEETRPEPETVADPEPTALEEPEAAEREAGEPEEELDDDPIRPPVSF
jgi:hypothetical protein